DIDHPSWVTDDQFVIDRHIFRGNLPARHDRATLERIVGWMHAKLLNRARPLWEFYVFEGMKDNEVGLYSKMHHACIDGGAGAALTNMIYDVTPIPRRVDPPAVRAKVGPEPRNIAANLLDSYQQLWTQPLDAAAASSSLSRAKALAKQAGGKLNDVVLALSSAVVRRYLLDHGALPAKALTAAVPISLREEGNTDSNNQVFGMICSIATDIEDPKARLAAIIAQSTTSKEMSHPLRALMPQVSNISMLGAPILVQVLALLY